MTITKDAAKNIGFLMFVIISFVSIAALFGYLAGQKVESIKEDIRRIAIEAVTPPTADKPSKGQ